MVTRTSVKCSFRDVILLLKLGMVFDIQLRERTKQLLGAGYSLVRCTLKQLFPSMSVISGGYGGEVNTHPYPPPTR